MRVPRPSVPRTVALVAVAAAATLGLVSPATAAPTPSTATSNAAAIRPVLHGIDLEAATIPDLQRAMDRGRISSVELTASTCAGSARSTPRSTPSSRSTRTR